MYRGQWNEIKGFIARTLSNEVRIGVQMWRRLWFVPVNYQDSSGEVHEERI